MRRLRAAITTSVSLTTVLVGCSSTASRTDPVPVTVTQPTSAAPVTTSTTPVTTSTTLVPFVPPVVLVNPTMPPVDYPPGATEADLKAAEAAALNFWTEVDRQFGLLPNENLSAILDLTYPGKGAARRITENLARVKAKGQRFRPASVNQQQINWVEVVAPFLINLEVCLADDGVVMNPNGNPESSELGASYITVVVKRRAGTWLVADYATARPYAPGKTCED